MGPEVLFFYIFDFFYIGMNVTFHKFLLHVFQLMAVWRYIVASGAVSMQTKDQFMRSKRATRALRLSSDLFIVVDDSRHECGTRGIDMRA
jgi:hypothetical protein